MRTCLQPTHYASSRLSAEVAAYDQQLLNGLALLRADPVLDTNEQQAIDDLAAPLDSYRSASQSGDRAGPHLA